MVREKRTAYPCHRRDPYVMPYCYVDPGRKNDLYSLPDVEIWYAHEPHKQRGFYYAYGFPGCLHDSDPSGPFHTEQAALDDAREGRIE